MEIPLALLLWVILIGYVSVFVGDVVEDKLGFNNFAAAVIFIIAVHFLITPLIFIAVHFLITPLIFGGVSP